jgi:hypothetical protein
VGSPFDAEIHLRIGACTAEDDRVVEHPMTGVIAKRLGSSWIDVLARLLLIATGVTDRTRT